MFNIEAFKHKFGCYIKKMAPTGSRVICDPPPTDTDEDWIVLIHQKHRKNVGWALTCEGFLLGGYDGDEDGLSLDFQAYRLKTDTEDLNLILTEDVEFYEKFVLATEIAQHLNLLSKKDRINLFKQVLYDESHDDIL